MILHSFTSAKGKIYMVKLEPGKGAENTDKFTMQTLNEKGQAIPMTSTFHGEASIQMMLKEMGLALEKYRTWRANNLPAADGESRRIDVTAT